MLLPLNKKNVLRFDNIVYGPVHSRRLGISLGVNLLPADGKLCSFDCIYCECGLYSDGRTSTPMPTLPEVTLALGKTLASMADKGEKLDVITFAGHGEPCLNPDFPAIIDATVALRDEFCPDTKIAVLSNSMVLDKEDVFLALKKVDDPIMKLDAADEVLVNAIDRPNVKFDLDHVIANLERFEGDFIMQTMFLGGARPDYRKDKAALEGWFDAVRRLHPRQVMVYTLDRPAPVEGLEKFSYETMRSLLEPLINEGFNIQIN